MMTRGPAWVTLVVGVLVLLVGVVWIGQGAGFIGGSFMSGSATWGIVGLIAVVVGGLLVARWLRLSRRP